MLLFDMWYGFRYHRRETYSSVCMNNKLSYITFANLLNTQIPF
jgi:hypothetical protein